MANFCWVRFSQLLGSLVMHFCAFEAIFWQGLRGEIRDFLEDRVRISLLSLGFTWIHSGPRLGPYRLTLSSWSIPAKTVSWGQGQRPSW